MRWKVCHCKCKYLGAHCSSQTAVHQLGSRALGSMWGWYETTDLWRSITMSLWLWARQSQHSFSLCMPWPCFSWLLASGILGLGMLSEMKALPQSAQTGPGLDGQSSMLLMLLILTPGVAPKWAVSAGQLCHSPACHRNSWGCVCTELPFFARG